MALLGLLSSKSVLVVGGCGFLGHHMVMQLQEAGANVAVIDLDIDRNVQAQTTYRKVNITSKAACMAAIEELKPEVIFHTVAPLAHDTSEALHSKVTIGGTINLLESAQAVGCVRAFIYTSSASVTDDNIHDSSDVDETWPVLKKPAQTDNYSHAKAVAEEAVLVANRRSNMLTAAIRPSALFGEGDQALTGSMLKRARSGGNKIQLGNGKNLFDFTYTANVVDVHILAAEALLRATSTSRSATGLSRVPDSKRVDGQAFLVTKDKPIPFWGFAMAVGDAAGFHTPVESIRRIPRWLALIIAYVSTLAVALISWGKRKPVMTVKMVRLVCMYRTHNVTKAKERLGYKPRFSMAEGIRRSMDWALDEENKKGK